MSQQKVENINDVDAVIADIVETTDKKNQLDRKKLLNIADNRKVSKKAILVSGDESNAAKR